MVRKEKPVLVLGSSSWIGHYLLPELHFLLPSVTILAGYSSHLPSQLPPNAKPIKISSRESGVLDALDFSAVVHLARGESEEDFQFLQKLTQKANRLGGRILYASSANALDGGNKEVYYESDTANASSEYGKFKARSENEVLQNCSLGLVFRFAAIHGYAPNRKARTQEFLERLQYGEKINVPRGVIQNRLFVGDLAKMIARLVGYDPAKGIWHLGTSDESEEFQFLQRLAKQFGYEENQILPGPKQPLSLVMKPQKLIDHFPNETIPTEEITLQKLRDQAELQPFRRSI